MSICWMRTWESMDVKRKKDILKALNLAKILFDDQGYHCKFLGDVEIELKLMFGHEVQLDLPLKSKRTKRRPK